MSSPAEQQGPTEQEWEAAVGLLSSAPDVVLLCHVGPDGDALGSMLALGAALRDAGCRVVASWGAARPGEPFELPASYAFLPGLDLLVPPADVPAAPDLLVTLDCSTADRLGDLTDRLTAARATVVVDHHANGERFGDVHLVDPSAAATAVLVAELLDRLALPVTPEIATGLYTGLVTDTGSFKHASTTPQVHELAARLLATGIRPDVISRAVWDTSSFRYVGLLGDVCARAELDEKAVAGLGLVWTAVTADDLRRHGVGLADVEGVIDVLRTAVEAEVAVVVKQEPDGSALRVSTRSKGLVDLGAVCTSLGGGGHRFAAGFTSYDDVATTLARLQDALADAPHLPA